jgi:rod shape-determining protein MreD
VYDNNNSIKYFYSIASVTITFLLVHLQLNFSTNIQINFVLLSVVYWALEEKKPIIGPIFAFVIGLLLDLVTGKILGMSAGIYAIISYIAITLRISFFTGNVVKRIGILVMLSLSYLMISSWELHLFYHGNVEISFIKNAFANCMVFILGFAILGKLGNSYYSRTMHE